MKTDDLITALVADRAAKPPKPKAAIMAAAAGGAVIAAVLFLSIIGFRNDIAAAVETYRFLFKFVVTLTLAASAIALALQVLRPEASPGRWLWGIAIAPGLLLLAVVAELVVMPSATWMPRLIGTNARVCLTVIPLLSIVPLTAFLWALRQGAPARPGLAGALAGLGAGGIAATLYASHCTDDSPLFVMTWYSLAIGLVTLVGYLAGKRWLAW
ncbi:NrsF family protein [Taklimakanibacter lacteus]|uniref:NrsF family protein n=1 Tax=Taklimakanibacter lacteus TaxID=2268456 RepID=UPI000E66EDD2